MASNQVLVPDIGDAENVEVIEICVKNGDEIEAEDSIVVLESDKATIEVPALEAGKIAELKVSVGDKVSQGDLLLLMSSDAAVPTQVADKEKPSSVVEEPASPPAKQVEVPPGEKSGESSNATAEITLVIPDIGDVDEAEVIEISIAVGDTIEFDQPLITLETDKASMEIPATSAGKVTSILVSMGDKLKEGSPVAVVQGADTAASSQTSDSPIASTVDQPTTTAPDAVSAPVTSSASASPGSTSPASSKTEPVTNKQLRQQVTANNHASQVHAGPAVRRLANKMGVNLSQVKGTGRKDRIIKEDVHAYVKQQLSQPAATASAVTQLPVMDFSKHGPIESLELSKIQRLSAQNLHRAWTTIPHVTQQDEADITELEVFRKEQSASYKDQGIKLTPLAFMVKACASTLLAFPRFRSSLHPSGDTLIMKNYCHIGIAVDTPNGLVVPVIKDADKKSIVQIAQEMQVLSEKARNKKLSPADMSGGCFSISSLGGIGGTAFTPIVNWPEVAILGVSKSSMKPEYIDGEFVPRLKLPLSLSYDHRVIDGADAARFTTHLSGLLSDIRRLLL